MLEEHRRPEREHGRARLQPSGERAVGQAPEVEVVDLVTVLTEDLPDQAGPRIVPLACGLGEQELAGLDASIHGEPAYAVEI